MKKLVCAICLLAIVAIGSPVMAQGPFADVPTDHWAYDAVNQLAQDGIIVGYPDGTFGGKRAMTRFEFAQALSKAIPVLKAMMITPAPGSTGVSQGDFDALAGRVTTLENKKPEVTKADLDLINKTMNEFKDELAGLGVDVDALKKCCKDLGDRVSAIEEELKRVKITGTAMAGVVFEKTRDGIPVDRDERTLYADDDLLQNVAFVREIDLKINVNAGNGIKAFADINVGNYLNYLGFVDDYDDSSRPLSASDDFFPYYLYASVPVGPGTITGGRLPLQWTPYTLKKIDVDSYLVDEKTDDGNYPVDGIDASFKWGGVGLQLFAGKTDGNTYLLNGLTSQAFAGMYSVFGVFNDVGGFGMGGLSTVEQIAGARVTIGTPWKGTLGLDYLQAASSDSAPYDEARQYGADFNASIGRLMIGAEYAQVITAGSVADVDDQNTALDANLGYSFGALGLKGGWKSIGHNFTAAGSWDKFGRWTNPTNIEGPYVNLNLGLGSSLNFTAGAEFMSGRDDVAGLPFEIDGTGDDIDYYTAGLKWGFSQNSSLDLGMEWVRWMPDGLDSSDEKYITIGLGHKFSENTMARISYQIIDFEPGVDGHIYSGGLPGDLEYKGDVAVAQFMVKF